MNRSTGVDELTIDIAMHPEEGRPVHGHSVDRYFVLVLHLEDDDAVRPR